MPARPAPRAASAHASSSSSPLPCQAPADLGAPAGGCGRTASPGAGGAPGTILRADPRHLAYVVALQKRNHEALGFISRAALCEKIGLGRVWLAAENGDPAGFLHHGSLAGPEVRIFQAAVQYDARRRHLGLALVADLLARARAAGARGVSLRCLDVLDANDFWTAAGFGLLTTEPGARGTLNVWGHMLGREGRDTGTGGSAGDKGTGGQGDKGMEVEAPATRSSASVPLSPCPLVPLSPCPLVPLSPCPLVPLSPFPFHSRIHPCPRCGAPTTDTWTRGAVRRRVCVRCVTLT